MHFWGRNIFKVAPKPEAAEEPEADTAPNFKFIKNI